VNLQMALMLTRTWPTQTRTRTKLSRTVGQVRWWQGFDSQRERQGQGLDLQQQPSSRI